jgi:copper chaperone CopZ
MRTQVHIQNLKCGGCANTITKRLSEIKNISEVVVNQDEETVSFDYHTSHDFERAKHVLEMLGYPVLGDENNLITKAKSYISCAVGRTKK